jgi:hypothetical protein
MLRTMDFDVYKFDFENLIIKFECVRSLGDKAMFAE